MSDTQQRHPFHLVDPSPWPLFTSGSIFSMMVGSVMYFQGFIGGSAISLISFVIVALCAGLWWRDIVREGTFQGHHTVAVQRGLKLGLIGFISTEVWFFVAFFWAYFHASLSPSVELGCSWPPLGIHAFDPFGVPLANTLILLTSGATITWAHHAMIGGNHKSTVLGLILTVILAAAFTGLQALEYAEATFNISDGVYGSTFYMATGFHGFHVIVGTIFIFVCLIRQTKYHFTREHHVGFEGAAWYWHFVDVVWLILFVAIYWWGSL
jgi:cytochrome c oxidase subunit 3